MLIRQIVIFILGIACGAFLGAHNSQPSEVYTGGGAIAVSSGANMAYAQCSVDGRRWFPARSDGTCYAADAWQAK